MSEEEQIASGDRTLIGWEEWCAFPKLGLPAIKAKVDTGARTSCLHAFDIKILKRGRGEVVKFGIHPVQRNSKIVKYCTAPLVDNRYVMSSSGHKEKRCVILATLEIGGESMKVEVTLTKRDGMAFRMLLGREALRKCHLLVDPGKSCVLGKKSERVVKGLYKKKKKD